MSDEQLLHTDVSQRVGYIFLDNGQRFNTLHTECIHALQFALTAFEADPLVGCVVLTGEPGKVLQSVQISVKCVILSRLMAGSFPVWVTHCLSRWNLQVSRSLEL